jgi:hypothetical protein
MGSRLSARPWLMAAILDDGLAQAQAAKRVEHRLATEACSAHRRTPPRSCGR